MSDPAGDVAFRPVGVTIGLLHPGAMGAAVGRDLVDAGHWRWEGEMREIARTLADAGVPDGFHRAAAAIYGSPPD